MGSGWSRSRLHGDLQVKNNELVDQCASPVEYNCAGQFYAHRGWVFVWPSGSAASITQDRLQDMPSG